MFSVVIPIHNKLPHLSRSIKSVLNQTYKDFELILVDDASTDGSSEKVLDFKDPRIKLLRRKCPGPGGYAARNLGIKEAKYQWISFLDADDEWDVDFLKEKEKAISRFSNLEIISSKWVYSKDEKTILVSGFGRIKPLYYTFSLIDFFNLNSLIWTSAVTIKRSLLIDAGLFPEGRCNRGGDMDTWIRCLYRSGRNMFVNRPLAIYYRDTVNQVTDSIKNPATKLCSLETIESIRSKTQDRKLLEAIDVFCSRYVYSFMVKKLQSRNVVDKSKLHILRSNKAKMKVLFKIYLYKIAIRFRIR